MPALPPLIQDSSISPGLGAFQPTKSDTVDLVDAQGNTVLARQIWFWASGTVSLVFQDGTTLTSWPVTAGTKLPDSMYVKRIMSTNTSLANSEMTCIK